MKSEGLKSCFFCGLLVQVLTSVACLARDWQARPPACLRSSVQGRAATTEMGRRTTSTTQRCPWKLQAELQAHQSTHEHSLLAPPTPAERLSTKHHRGCAVSRPQIGLVPAPRRPIALPCTGSLAQATLSRPATSPPTHCRPGRLVLTSCPRRQSQSMPRSIPPSCPPSLLLPVLTVAALS